MVALAKEFSEISLDFNQYLWDLFHFGNAEKIYPPLFESMRSIQNNIENFREDLNAVFDMDTYLWLT